MGLSDLGFQPGMGWLQPLRRKFQRANITQLAAFRGAPRTEQDKLRQKCKSRRDRKRKVRGSTGWMIHNRLTPDQPSLGAKMNALLRKEWCSVCVMRVGFEPTPFRTRYIGARQTCWSSLVWRLRPLGHLTDDDGRRQAVSWSPSLIQPQWSTNQGASSLITI